MNLTLQRRFSVIIRLQTTVAFLLLALSAGRAAAQGRRSSATTPTGASTVTIRGTVIAKHPALSVFDLSYTIRQRVETVDTAITDKAGMFMMQLVVPRAWVNDKAGSRRLVFSLSQPADSAVFSMAGNVYVSTLPFDTTVTVELYPRVTLPDGSLPKTAVPPRFSDARGSAQQFLGQELEYPEEARDAGIQGTVVVRFLVDEQGALRRPEIVRGVGGGCSDEVLRVTGKMPAWIPGQMDGKPTAMMYYLPVQFTLE